MAKYKVTKYERDWAYSFTGKDGKAVNLVRDYVELDGVPAYKDRKPEGKKLEVGDEVEGEFTGKTDKNGVKHFRKAQVNVGELLKEVEALREENKQLKAKLGEGATSDQPDSDSSPPKASEPAATDEQAKLDDIPF